MHLEAKKFTASSSEGKDINKSSIEKIEQLLNSDFHSDKLQTIGLPSVNYCADQLHLSPNYFGDLVKKRKRPPPEYITLKVMEITKERILDTSRSISEVVCGLGFKYLHHFSRFLKKKYRLYTE